MPARACSALESVSDCPEALDEPVIIDNGAVGNITVQVFHRDIEYHAPVLGQFVKATQAQFDGHGAPDIVGGAAGQGGRGRYTEIVIRQLAAEPADAELRRQAQVAELKAPGYPGHGGAATDLVEHVVFIAQVELEATGALVDQAEPRHQCAVAVAKALEKVTVVFLVSTHPVGGAQRHAQIVTAQYPVAQAWAHPLQSLTEVGDGGYGLDDAGIRPHIGAAATDHAKAHAPLAGIAEDAVKRDIDVVAVVPPYGEACLPEAGRSLGLVVVGQAHRLTGNTDEVPVQGAVVVLVQVSEHRHFPVRGVRYHIGFAGLDGVAYFPRGTAEFAECIRVVVDLQHQGARRGRVLQTDRDVSSGCGPAQQ